MLASVFNLSEHPTIKAFAEKSALEIEIDLAKVQLKQKKWSKCVRNLIWVNNVNDCSEDYGPVSINIRKEYVEVTDNDKTAKDTCVKLRRIGKDGRFKIIGYEGDPLGVTEKREVHVENDTRWKIIRLFQIDDPGSQLFLITSVKYPAMFMTIDKNDFKLTTGDPGEHGYW